MVHHTAAAAAVAVASLVNRRNIFLRNIPLNANMIPESNIAAGKCNRTIRRDNSVLQRDFKTHHFEFTKQDIDVLQRYTEVVEHSKMVGENYLTFIFNKASSITSEFLKKDFFHVFALV